MTVHIETVACCLDCDWQAAGVRADTEAEKHTRKTGHGTTVSGRPT